jgi:hypothetical protein
LSLWRSFGVSRKKGLITSRARKVTKTGNVIHHMMVGAVK